MTTTPREPQRLILTYRRTIGCYAVDPDGRDWATFSGPPVPCARCGATITRGWCRALSDEHVCVEHAETRQPDGR